MVKKTIVAVAVLLAAVFAFARPGRSRSVATETKGSSLCSTADAEIVKVKGRGVGADRAEALKDAYRDAVERAVGLYVDAEQMVKNEELVKDQILTHSNAYIEKYDVAKETTRPNGLVEVQILADVRKTALTKKISDVMPAQTFRLNTSVTQNLHAQLVTDEKRSADGAALLKNALEGLDPVRQLVKATLASPEPTVVEDKGKGRSRSRGMEEDKDFVTLRYLFKFEIDRDRYFKEFLPHIQKTFEQISTTEPKTIWLTGERSKYSRRESVTFYGNSGNRRISTVNRGAADTVGLYGDVLLFTECDEKLTTAKARLYSLSEPAGKVLAAWQSRFVWRGRDYGRQMASYNIVVKSKDGDAICVVPFSLSYRDLMPIAPSATARGNARTALIAPMVGVATDCYSHPVDCKIPKDDLPNVASITIEPAE